MDIPPWATAITYAFTIAFPLASLVSVTWVALAGQKRSSEAVAVQQNHEQRMALLAERFAVSRTFTEQRYAAYALVLREVQMARQKMDEVIEEKKAAGKTSVTLYQGDLSTAIAHAKLVSSPQGQIDLTNAMNDFHSSHAEHTAQATTELLAIFGRESAMDTAPHFEP
jgi:hypothetical protein